MFHTTQCAWSSEVLLRATSMSCMLRKNDCVPAGTLVQVMAGDVPSPGATPSAAWLNRTGMGPPSGNPATVMVIGGAAAAGAAPRCCAAIGIAMITVKIETTSPRPARMLLLLALRYTKYRSPCDRSPRDANSHHLVPPALELVGDTFERNMMSGGARLVGQQVDIRRRLPAEREEREDADFARDAAQLGHGGPVKILAKLFRV